MSTVVAKIIEPKGSRNRLAKKGINLLTDTQGRWELKQRLSLLYKSVAVVFATGVILLSSLWGWTQYEILRNRKLEDDLSTKKQELLGYADRISLINTYQQRLYQIRDLNGGKDSAILQAFDDLNLLAEKNKIEVRSFEVNGSEIGAMVRVEDIQILHNLLGYLEGEEMKTQWKNVVVKSVTRDAVGQFLVELKATIVSK